jgi:hypothetical protein
MPSADTWISVAGQMVTYATTFTGNFAPVFAVIGGVGLFGLLLAMLARMVTKD